MNRYRIDPLEPVMMDDLQWWFYEDDGSLNGPYESHEDALREAEDITTQK